MEFSKKLLIVVYIIFVILCIATVLFPSVELATVTVAWTAQTAISSGGYYWKTKSDNRIKIPLKVIESLPSEIREQLDLTQVIISIIQSE